MPQPPPDDASFHDLREPGSDKLLARYDPARRVLQVKRPRGDGPVEFVLGEDGAEVVRDRPEIR